MRLSVNECSTCEETEIIINCKTVDEQVLRVMAAIRVQEKKLTGEKGGKTFLLEPEAVFYFESVDKKTFLYTAKDVYETPLRLYELEGRLAGGDFFRASKATIVNLAKVRQLNPMFGGKIELLLENGEHQLVSRQYVPQLKKMLGM